MFFWKLDDETIRCLIGKREIDDMGYNLKELTENSDLMGEFLDHIVNDSHKFVEWNTENGVQTYVARSLPGEQFLFTISCTFVDDSINRDLDQIKRMTEELTQTVTPERIDEIYNLSGEEKEKAFHDLTLDLQAVYTGGNSAPFGEEETKDDIDMSPMQMESEAEEEKETPEKEEPAKDEKKTSKKPVTPKIFIFKNFDDLVSFSCQINQRELYHTMLYKLEEEYHLVADFSDCKSNVQAIAFMIMAEEYGAKCKELNYGNTYLAEHARLMIADKTLEVLKSLGH